MGPVCPEIDLLLSKEHKQINFQGWYMPAIESFFRRTTAHLPIDWFVGYDPTSLLHINWDVKVVFPTSEAPITRTVYLVAAIELFLEEFRSSSSVLDLKLDLPEWENVRLRKRAKIVFEHFFLHRNRFCRHNFFVKWKCFSVQDREIYFKTPMLFCLKIIWFSVIGGRHCSL